MESNVDDVPFVSAPHGTLQETTGTYVLEASLSVIPSEGELFGSNPHDSTVGPRYPLVKLYLHIHKGTSLWEILFLELLVPHIYFRIPFGQWLFLHLPAHSF